MQKRENVVAAVILSISVLGAALMLKPARYEMIPAGREGFFVRYDKMTDSATVCLMTSWEDVQGGVTSYNIVCR